MNLRQKKAELEQLIADFIDDESRYAPLREFAWDVIGYFTDKKDLPPYEDFENVFWATIWSIQHLADPGHIADGVMTKEMNQLLKYLKDEEIPPKTLKGSRPNP